MVGISGSGKSTFSKNLSKTTNVQLVETDAIREELTGNASDQSQNGRVFSVAKTRVENYLKNNQSVIIDATSVNHKSRKMWVEVGKQNKAKVIAYYINTPLDIALARNNNRDRKVPDDVIRKQHSMLTKPSVSEGIDEVYEIK